MSAVRGQRSEVRGRVPGSGFRVPGSGFRASRSGQAMIELMAGLILILLVVVGALQFIDIAWVHSAIDSRIRGDAGVVAISSPQYVDQPDYILTWREGTDGQRLTADDKKVLGSPGVLYTIADHSTAKPADWSEFTLLSHPSALESLHSAFVPLSALGFIGVRQSHDVPVRQLIQDLVYNKPSVHVSEEVWLPVTKGLY